jgi:hypothetical protein
VQRESRFLEIEFAAEEGLVQLRERKLNRVVTFKQRSDVAVFSGERPRLVVALVEVTEWLAFEGDGATEFAVVFHVITKRNFAFAHRTLLKKIARSREINDLRAVTRKYLKGSSFEFRVSCFKTRLKQLLIPEYGGGREKRPNWKKLYFLCNYRVI